MNEQNDGHMKWNLNSKKYMDKKLINEWIDGWMNGSITYCINKDNIP